MKKYMKIICLIISLLIIIAGVTVLFISGFEKSLEYQAGTRIEVYVPKGYEKQEILNLAKECFETDEMLFSEVEKLEQVAGIKIIKEYSEEQLDNYLTKISEKYEINKKEIEYYEISVPETKISTIIMPYMLPALFSTALVLLYIILKNFKSEDSVKIPLRILKILVITLGLYFSFILIFRIQFSIYTMPIALAIFIVDLLITTNKKCE